MVFDLDLSIGLSYGSLCCVESSEDRGVDGFSEKIIDTCAEPGVSCARESTNSVRSQFLLNFTVILLCASRVIFHQCYRCISNFITRISSCPTSTNLNLLSPQHPPSCSAVHWRGNIPSVQGTVESSSREKPSAQTRTTSVCASPFGPRISTLMITNELIITYIPVRARRIRVHVRVTIGRVLSSGSVGCVPVQTPVEENICTG